MIYPRADEIVIGYPFSINVKNSFKNQVISRLDKINKITIVITSFQLPFPLFSITGIETYKIIFE